MKPNHFQFGDLSREVSSRVKNRVEAFTGKPYEVRTWYRATSSQHGRLIAFVCARSLFSSYVYILIFEI
jgi:hypothetical protein